MTEQTTDYYFTDIQMNPMHQKQSSLFWKGLPVSEDAIDLWKAFEGSEEVVAEWLRMLIAGEDFSITLYPGKENAGKFRHIFTESRNLIKTEGPQCFGFAYPLVFDYQEETPGHPIVAPLFFWNFTINAHASKQDAWVIKRVPSIPVIINDMLFEYLYLKYHLDLRQVVRQLALDGKLSKDTLQNIIQEVAEVLNNGDEKHLFETAPFPDTDTCLEWAKTGLIFNSGFFGVFKPQYVRRFQMPVENRILSDKMDSVDHQKLHSITLNVLDPSQKAVLLNAQKYKLTVVEGVSGTGKSHTIVNIVANALSLEQKCLIISPAVASLKKIQKDLSEKGLAHLTMLYDDEWLDKNLLLELLKLESEGRDISFDNITFQKIFDQAKRIDLQAESAFKALYAPSFGEESWSDTVGRFLSSNRIHGKELLFSQLNPNEYSFNKEEYDRLKMVIESAEPLYNNLKTLKHPLKNLNAELFSNNTLENGRYYLETQLQHFSAKVLQLQHRYIQKTFDYTEKIHDQYELNFEYFNSSCKQILKEIADIENEYGKEALLTDFFHEFMRLFSKKYRTLNSKKSGVWNIFLQLKKDFEHARYFEFPFFESRRKFDLVKLKQSMTAFSGAIQHWRQRLPASIQEEIQKLNSKNIHTDIDFQEQIEDLEYSLDLLCEEMNNAGIFQEQVSNKMLTIPKRQQFLEEIQENIDQTLQNLRDYPVFYPWQKFWLSTNDKEKRLLAALIRIKPTDWMAAFDSWFFQNRLSLDFNTQIPHDDALLESLKAIYPAVESGFPSHISQIWLNKKRNALKEIKKTETESLIARNNSEILKNKSPFEVFSISPEYITSVFPVMLATPQVASEVLSSKNEMWDLVLIDDAQAIGRDIGIELLQFGRRAVVSGNESQTLPEAPPTLFDELVDAMEHIFTLRYLHRRKMYPVLRLSNAIQTAAPVRLRYDDSNSGNGLEILDVAGSFDKVMKVNISEAETILDYLLKLTPTSGRIFPSVGIVTFNTTQRDYISWLLLTLKQKQETGHEMIGQLQRNGLGVFCINEMEGQHFDIVIASCTVNQLENEDTDTVMDSKNPASQAYTELLLSRAREKLVICHSFNKKTIDAKKSMQSDGFGQLIQVIQAGNIVNHLPEIVSNGVVNHETPSLDTDSDRFKKEVAYSLYPYLEKGRVHIDTEIACMSFPITIKPIYEHQPPFVILAGGYYGQEHTPSFGWEVQIRKEIEDMGLPFAATYAYNWWNNPRLEARRLASLIVKHDNQYQK